MSTRPTLYDLRARVGGPRDTDHWSRRYGAEPGSGPAGETCKSCANACQVSGGSRAYWKCAIIKHRWSGCYATDIRLKSPACSFWEGKK